jgi:hypothetical protein
VRAEHLIGTALAAGADSQAIIHVADFGAAGLRTIDSDSKLPDQNMRPILLAAGLVDALPAGHWLRSVMPAEQLYLHGGQAPAIILGPVAANGTPRAWYPLALARTLTVQFRAKQVRDAEEQDYQDRLEQAREARNFEQSEVGQLRRRLQLLDELERAGKLPPEVRPEPAVRIGRG